MSDSGPGSLYVIDTSALMDWHDRFYPPDIFASVVDRLDGLAHGQRLLSAELVRDEIAAIGSAGLAVWAKERKAIFDPTPSHLAEALAIEGAYPGLRDPRAQYDEADAYVIAIARLRNGVVVTAETPASHKRKPKRSLYIPDVCAAMGMTCITLVGMMRREGWRI